MGVTNFSIVLDNPLATYCSGQIVTGRVIVCVDKPKKIRGIEIKFKGKAKVRWSENETYNDSQGKSHDRIVVYTASEQYFKNQYNLVGKGHEFELTIGEHVYNFNHTLSHGLPSSYNGEYGGISYYVKAKMDIPWSVDKKIKCTIPVHSPYDLNTNPQLKDPVTDEDEKTFCCLCCASGPLTVKAYLPKTGFAFGTNIPVTVEVNNTSNVAISKVTCSIIQIIKWIVRNPRSDYKTRKNKLVTIELGDASQRSNRTWNENLTVPETVLPNLSQCGIIDMLYYIKVTADPEGAHKDLDVEIPIELGDVPLYDGEYNPTTSTPASVYPNVPSIGGYPQPSVPLYPGAGQSQYLDSSQQQYPGSGQPQYPGSGQPQYPGSGQPQYPGSGQPQYPGSGQPQYPGSGQPQYPGSGQLQYPSSGQPQYPTSGQPQYPTSGQQQYPGPGQAQYLSTEQSQYPGAGQPQSQSGGQPLYPSSGPYAGTSQLTYSSAGGQPSFLNMGQTPYPNVETGILRPSSNHENQVIINEKDTNPGLAPSAPEST